MCPDLSFLIILTYYLLYKKKKKEISNGSVIPQYFPLISTLFMPDMYCFNAHFCPTVITPYHISSIKMHSLLQVYVQIQPQHKKPSWLTWPVNNSEHFLCAISSTFPVLPSIFWFIYLLNYTLNFMERSTIKILTPLNSPQSCSIEKMWMKQWIVLECLWIAWFHDFHHKWRSHNIILIMFMVLATIKIHLSFQTFQRN